MGRPTEPQMGRPTEPQMGVHIKPHPPASGGQSMFYPISVSRTVTSGDRKQDSSSVTRGQIITSLLAHVYSCQITPRWISLSFAPDPLRSQQGIICFTPSTNRLSFAKHEDVESILIQQSIINDSSNTSTIEQRNNEGPVQFIPRSRIHRVDLKDHEKKTGPTNLNWYWATDGKSWNSNVVKQADNYQKLTNNPPTDASFPDNHERFSI